MAILQVRDFPDDLHKQLIELAQTEHRSLAQQVTVLLKTALEQTEANKHRRARSLDAIKNTMKSRVSKKKLSDPSKLVREDRER